jgi:predicted N-acetyltransferase YhbS
LMKDRLHYYLWGLAVDPKWQQKGVGTALLKPFLEKADSEKMPVYLETHDEKNVLYYQRQGFSLIHTSSIPKYELPIWCMLREPV